MPHDGIVFRLSAEGAHRRHPGLPPHSGRGDLGAAACRLDLDFAAGIDTLALDDTTEVAGLAASFFGFFTSLRLFMPLAMVRPLCLIARLWACITR